MTKIIFALLLFFQSFNVNAECSAAYKDYIKSLEARMNPPKATLFTNLIGEAAFVGSLIVFTGAAPIGAVLVLPATALGAGSYYGNLSIRRDGLRNGMNLIRDAHRGSGKTLDRFLKKLKRKMGLKAKKIDDRDIIETIIRGDVDQTFCQVDEVKNKADLYSFKKILRYVKKLN